MQHATRPADATCRAVQHRQSTCKQALKGCQLQNKPAVHTTCLNGFFKGKGPVACMTAMGDTMSLTKLEKRRQQCRPHAQHNDSVVGML
jgi:hypothetical protein